jgi:shikimate kinase
MACMGQDHQETAPVAPAARIAPERLQRPIVLVGLMGAGKTTVGRRLAAALHLPFLDADEEIEKAAGLSIPEIFARHGEAEFRRGERRVIARLLDCGGVVLATGGGAFIDPETRALVRERATSVWLRADLDVLMKRVERRDNRPLLKADNPRAVMARLIQDRYPIYAEADFVVDSNNSPHGAAVDGVIAALAGRLP